MSSIHIISNCWLTACLVRDHLLLSDLGLCGIKRKITCVSALDIPSFLTANSLVNVKRCYRRLKLSHYFSSAAFEEHKQRKYSLASETVLLVSLTRFARLQNLFHVQAIGKWLIIRK